jgi:putative ABC transport system permease protein
LKFKAIDSMFRYLPLIFKSSMRSKRRSLLTIASASLSLCLLGTLMAIYHAFFVSEAPPQQALRLITRNRVSPAIKLPISHVDKIRRIPGVREAAAFQFFGGTYKNPKNIFARYAVDPERIFTIRTDCQMPESVKQAFRKQKTSCLLGRGLANRYDLKTGDRVSLKGDIFPVNVDLTVAGIYDNPTDNDSLWFRIDYLFDLLPKAYQNQVFAIQILADSADSVGRISKEVDEMFRNSTAPPRRRRSAPSN